MFVYYKEKSSGHIALHQYCVRVLTIDREDDEMFWDQLPEPTSREYVNFCFRNYIPPHISVFNSKTNRVETYYFGNLFQRNGISLISDHIYKTYDEGTESQVLMKLKLANEKLDEHRLNSGICSYEQNGVTKIMLLGGSNGQKIIKDYESAQGSLHDS